MADDLYGDDGGSATTTTADRPGDTAPDREGEEKKDGEAKTALVNQEICPGLEVGDEFVAKVTGVQEKEYTIQYVEKPKDEEAPEAGAPPEPPPGPPGGGGSMFE